MAEAATAALVSRTTAYRYLPNQTALLIAAHPETGGHLARRHPTPGLSADERLRRRGEQRFMQRASSTPKASSGTMLLLSLQVGTASDLPLRKGRAIGWFEDALAPLRDRLSEADVHRLAVAIRGAVGIEALIWLTDVAGLTQAQAAGLMQWSAQALLREAVTNGLPPNRERLTPT